MASQTTAAATGQVGVLRRDPMAMKPFCGYNFADYWAHWLSFSEKSDKLPKIFHVNWFRQDESGEFMWPGFGENLRVLNWILDRVDNNCDAVETHLGYVPRAQDINTKGLKISSQTMQQLCEMKPEGWKQEWAQIGDYLDTYNTRFPQALKDEYDRIATALFS